MSPDFESVIRHRAEVVHGSAWQESDAHEVAAEEWSTLHYVLGLPIVVLSAIASTSAFSDFPYSDVVAGVIALIVAVLSALVTFLNPHKTSELHRTAAANYRTLAFRAQIIVDDLFLGTQAPQLLKRVRLNEDELEKLIRDSPACNTRIRGRARRKHEVALESGPGGGGVFARTA